MAQMFQNNARTRFSVGVPRMIALTRWLCIAKGGRYSDGLSQKLMRTISAADPHFLNDIFVIQHYRVVWFVKTLVVDREGMLDLLHRHLFERLMKLHSLPQFQSLNWDLAAVDLSGKCPARVTGDRVAHHHFVDSTIDRQSRPNSTEQPLSVAKSGTFWCCKPSTGVLEDFQF
ncbi:hypothetical protein B0H10DRAFT_2186271 [Mycena sp. CBHHK59/15]|nr:hypothetical protein B0H10DRAFT_2186271 [Mycena sp. CBHHK59/15]